MPIFKDAAEILDLIVGGLWVLNSFRRKDEPTLIARPYLTVDAKEWREADERSCTAHTAVSLKNDGVTAFYIDSIRVRVWVRSYKYPQGFGRVTVTDWLTQPATDSLWIRGRGTHPMLSRYVSGGSAYGNFDWRVAKAAETRFLWEIMYFGDEGITGTATWDDWICGVGPQFKG